MADADETELAELHSQLRIHNSKHQHRRAEEYEYWRKRAGWFDDDVSMMEFNNGVYDTYYQIDDDVVLQGGGIVGTTGQKNSSLATSLKIASILIAIAICILMYRAISRRLSGGKSKSKKNSSSKSTKSRSDSKSRGHSSSRSRAGRSSSSRSRSGRSRSRKSGSSASNYELMDDKTESQSRKSSRSRSRSRRSRSRAGSRSRSKSKTRASEKEVVLV